jgi:hypothetical protein
MRADDSSDRAPRHGERSTRWRIVVLCAALAAAYGVIHDQITIRISPEYFTLAHPAFFPTSDKTLLALCWGIAATWWVGAAFGFVLALLLQDGRPTKRLAARVAFLFAITGACAVIAGTVGYRLSHLPLIALPDTVAGAAPALNRERFAAVWFAHTASYAVGIAGGAMLLWRIWQERGRPAVLALYPATRAGLTRVLLLSACVLALIYWRTKGA